MNIFQKKTEDKINENKNEDLVYKINSNIDKICNIISSQIGNLKDLNENGFRDIVLIGLKLVLEEKNNPTSETYNSNGRCDIYIKLENYKTYISEFKFWCGKEQIEHTFSQLCEYLQWNSESSIIFINKNNKNYENINKKIKEWLNEKKCIIINEEKNQWYIEYKDPERERRYNIYVSCYDFYHKNNKKE